jgi:spermidine synthase
MAGHAPLRPCHRAPSPTPPFAAAMTRQPPGDHARPFVQETSGTKTLHFSMSEVQSRMDVRQPDTLNLAYTRMMMGFLLFEPAPKRILMIGLGGGSLAKFCHRHLPQARIDVVEINPLVIALRDEFRVPRDSERFRVIEGDGAEFVRRTETSYNVMLVDGYDRSGLPEALSSQRFYDDCFEALTPGGILVVNLHAHHPLHKVHVGRISRSFDGALLVVDDTARDNRIVFAEQGRPSTPIRIGPLRRPRNLEEPAWQTLQASFSRILSALKDADR